MRHLVQYYVLNTQHVRFQQIFIQRYFVKMPGTTAPKRFHLFNNDFGLAYSVFFEDRIEQ